MGRGATATRLPSLLAQLSTMAARGSLQVRLPGPVALSAGHQSKSCCPPCLWAAVRVLVSGLDTWTRCPHAQTWMPELTVGSLRSAQRPLASAPLGLQACRGTGLGKRREPQVHEGLFRVLMG